MPHAIAQRRHAAALIFDKKPEGRKPPRLFKNACRKPAVKTVQPNIFLQHRAQRRGKQNHVVHGRFQHHREQNKNPSAHKKAAPAAAALFQKKHCRERRDEEQRRQAAHDESMRPHFVHVPFHFLFQYKPRRRGFAAQSRSGILFSFLVALFGCCPYCILSSRGRVKRFEAFFVKIPAK